MTKESNDVQGGEREAFEAWVLREWPSAPLRFIRDALPENGPKYGEYVSDFLQRSWVGWQARAAQHSRIVAAKDAEIARIEQFERAYIEWHDKTEWVQSEVGRGVIGGRALGRHRADVMTGLILSMRCELAALKAQPSGVVLPERKEWHQCSGRDGKIGTDAYNKALDEVARLNSHPVSAGVVDERAAHLDASSERNAMQRQRDHLKTNLDRECDDADQLLRLIGLEPDEYRTDGGFINMAKVKAAQPDRSAQSREVMDGYVLVPVDPTDEMIAQADPLNRTELASVRSIYLAMLAAAPAPGKEIE